MRVIYTQHHNSSRPVTKKLSQVGSLDWEVSEHMPVFADFSILSRSLTAESCDREGAGFPPPRSDLPALTGGTDGGGVGYSWLCL